LGVGLVVLGLTVYRADERARGLRPAGAVMVPVTVAGVGQPVAGGVYG
jgi:hypothetical protein